MISNNEEHDEEFSRIIKAIFGQRDEAQIEQTDRLFVALDKRRNLDQIEVPILSKPLSDEDCFSPIKRLKKTDLFRERGAKLGAWIHPVGDDDFTRGLFAGYLGGRFLA